MTQKDIIKLATNEDALHLLNRIVEENSNLCYKTKYEVISANKHIKQWCKELQELIKE